MRHCSEVFRSTNQWLDIDYLNVVWRIHFRIRIDFVLYYSYQCRLYIIREPVSIIYDAVCLRVHRLSFWHILRDVSRRRFRDWHWLNCLLIELAELHFLWEIAAIRLIHLCCAGIIIYYWGMATSLEFSILGHPLRRYGSLTPRLAVLEYPYQT